MLLQVVGSSFFGLYKGILPDICFLLPNMINPTQIVRPTQPVAYSFPSPFLRVCFKKCT